MKNFLKIISISFLILSSIYSYSATVSSLIGIKLDQGEKLDIGSEYFLLNNEGKKKGLIKISSEHNGEYSASLIKGKAEIGWLLKLKLDGDISSDEQNENIESSSSIKENISDENIKKSELRRELARKRNKMKENFNLSFWPLSLGMFWQHVNLDYAFAEKFTFGISYDSIKISFLGVNYNLHSYNLEAKYFLNNIRFNDSWVATLLAGKVDRSVQFLDQTIEKGSGILIGAGIGYAWYWNVFNILLGYRVMNSSVSITSSETSSSSNSSSALFVGNFNFIDFTFGWKF